MDPSKKGAKWIGDHKEDIEKASIAFAGAVAAIAAVAGGTIGKFLSKGEKEFIGTILAATGISCYYGLKDCCDK